MKILNVDLNTKLEWKEEEVLRTLKKTNSKLNISLPSLKKFI